MCFSFFSAIIIIPVFLSADKLLHLYTQNSLGQHRVCLHHTLKEYMFLLSG